MHGIPSSNIPTPRRNGERNAPVEGLSSGRTKSRNNNNFSQQRGSNISGGLLRCQFVVQLETHPKFTHLVIPLQQPPRKMPAKKGESFRFARTGIWLNPTYRSPTEARSQRVLRRLEARILERPPQRVRFPPWKASYSVLGCSLRGLVAEVSVAPAR
jgi:hypothetical protein